MPCRRRPSAGTECWVRQTFRQRSVEDRSIGAQSMWRSSRVRGRLSSEGSRPSYTRAESPADSEPCSPRAGAEIGSPNRVRLAQRPPDHLLQELARNACRLGGAAVSWKHFGVAQCSAGGTFASGRRLELFPRSDPAMSVSRDLARPGGPSRSPARGAWSGSSSPGPAIRCLAGTRITSVAGDQAPYRRPSCPRSIVAPAVATAPAARRCVWHSSPRVCRVSLGRPSRRSALKTG